jgi:hypothetical protein
MNGLLDNPAIQAGVAPFVVALIASALLGRSRFLGLAVAAAFITLVTLAIGFSFESLNSVRKVVVVGLVTSALVVPLELAGSARALVWLRAGVSVAAGLAGLWVVWRILQQQDSGPAILAGAATALYLAALVASTAVVSADPVRASASALMLGLGAGALALLGASASMAQAGIAIGAGAGATLLVQMISGRRAPVGWTLSLPASVIVGLIGLVAVYAGALHWYCLLPILAAPWATRLVPPGQRPVWLTAFLSALAALIPMLLAVVLAWATTGALST